MIKFLLTICLFLSFSALTNAQDHGRFLGYRPVVRWYPQGVYWNVQANVSHDRRYVRIGNNIQFSHIPQVYTFNYVTGQYNRTR